ncbi:Ribosomal large subunit pseudouridine synthase C [wastewater metagenome]|uniref:Ribosomal large subunit pseudouridine synthase C n=2 Tax=unclassified sequences TaxID=12908 RepID=A0A5B8RFZ2_9ZZZZ|nr:MULTISPECIES: RluA family pseudouridine synthase [Arhodomonas]QEA05607.1 ribosomal large subunit pseudouridine synthase C [uncultured organism]
MGSQVRHIEIDPEYDGQRVDNYISRELRGVPKSLVYRLLRRGEVRVNGSRTKPTYRLRAGDRLRLPPVREGRGSQQEASTRVLERLRSRILHEDDDIIVVDKPSGMAVHGGSGIGYGVIEALRQLRTDCRFLDLVHRLDRDTSGCLVVAKRRAALKRLHAALREGGLDKRYTALLAGGMSAATIPVEARLERQSGPGGESMVRVSAAGRPARSVFHRRRRYTGWTLVDVDLETGRMHQIRVHAAHLGTPLAGDDRYGEHERNREARRLGLRRMFLHAARLSLPAADGTRLTVEAPLPTELTGFLDRLSEHHQDKES